MTEVLDNVSKTCLEALHNARNSLKFVGEEGRASVPSTKDEPVTKSDLEISKILRRYFLHSSLNAVYCSEEAGQINHVSNPDYFIYWDEIDGTFNFQRGGILPSSVVISVFNANDPLKFRDVFFAGVLDLSSGNLWYAESGKGCFFNGSKTKSFGKTTLGKNIYTVIDHGPCPKQGSNADVEKFLEVYRSTWAHNISSAGVHLAGVASGNFDVAILPIQKAHELGAGYLLVRESGRYIADFSGNSLDDQIFNFNNIYQIIAADTKELGQLLLDKIKK